MATGENEEKGFFERAYDKVVASVTPTRASDIERHLGRDGQSLKLNLGPALTAYISEHDIDALKNLGPRDQVLSILAYAGTGYDQAGTSYGDAASRATSGDFKGAAKSVKGSGMWDTWNSFSTSASTLLTAALTWMGEYFTADKPRSFMAIWNQEYTQSLAFAEADDVTTRLKNAKLGLSEEQIAALGDFTFHRAMARYAGTYPDIDTNITRRNGDTIIGSASTLLASAAGAVGASLGLTGSDGNKKDAPPVSGASADKVEKPASTTKLDVAEEAPEFQGQKADYTALAAFTGVDVNGLAVTTLSNVRAEAAVFLPLLPGYTYLHEGRDTPPIFLNLNTLKAIQNNTDGAFPSLRENIRALARDNLIRKGESGPDSEQITAEADAIIADTIRSHSGKADKSIVKLGKNEDGRFVAFKADEGGYKLTLSMVDENERIAVWNSGFITESKSIAMSDVSYREDASAMGISAFRGKDKASPQQIALGGKNPETITPPAFLPPVALPVDLAAFATWLQENKDEIAATAHSIGKNSDKREQRRVNLSTAEALQMYRAIAALEPEQIDILKANSAINALITDPTIIALAKTDLDSDDSKLNNVTKLSVASLTTGDTLKAFQDAGIDLNEIVVPKSFVEARTQITVADAKMLISLHKARLLGDIDFKGADTASMISELETAIKGQENSAYVDAKIVSAYNLPEALGETNKLIREKIAEILAYGSERVAQLETRSTTHASAETAAPGLATALAAADQMQGNMVVAASERIAGLQMDRARVQAAIASRGVDTQTAEAVIPVAADVAESGPVALVPNAKERGTSPVIT